MDMKKLIVGILFFIGAYMVMDVMIAIVRNDVEQDIKEKVLRDTIAKNKKVRCGIPPPMKNVDRDIARNLEEGCVYTASNMKLWKEVENVGSGDTCKKPIMNTKEKIRDTLHHGDKLLDSYRNDMIQTYNKEPEVNMEMVDPYDPEVYASVQEKKKACVQPSQTIFKLDKPLTGHTFITKDACDNPAPVKYPVLSDTHYLPEKMQKYTYVPSTDHCGLHPATNSVISSNLISDRMLSERMSSFKSIVSDNISTELIRTDAVQYDARDLVPQYNPLDKNLYKVCDRKPVSSMDQQSTAGNVCGFDHRYSGYAEIENNDFKETTSA